ncbi:uncharacterized protein LOC107270649 [Cephus cinctus]|uniref:Uncharacterized protein LOC107270649 n=1 Tax=Cephus cinctus TaxID=211228 RepID=A0AAJ7RNY6_CEPCN|nr:uncharacterized protein LOC107270649 [Cephus cinctus]
MQRGACAVCSSDIATSYVQMKRRYSSLEGDQVGWDCILHTSPGYYGRSGTNTLTIDCARIINSNVENRLVNGLRGWIRCDITLAKVTSWEGFNGISVERRHFVPELKMNNFVYASQPSRHVEFSRHPPPGTKTAIRILDKVTSHRMNHASLMGAYNP